MSHLRCRPWCRFCVLDRGLRREEERPQVFGDHPSGSRRYSCSKDKRPWMICAKRMENGFAADAASRQRWNPASVSALTCVRDVSPFLFAAFSCVCSFVGLPLCKRRQPNARHSVVVAKGRVLHTSPRGAWEDRAKQNSSRSSHSQSTTREGNATSTNGGWTVVHSGEKVPATEPAAKSCQFRP